MPIGEYPPLDIGRTGSIRRSSTARNPAVQFRYRVGDPARFSDAVTADTESFADNAGKREVQVLNELAERDDEAAFGPPAIEVVTGPPVVAKLSEGTPSPGTDGHLGENGIYLHYLEPDPDADRRTVIVEWRDPDRVRAGQKPWWDHGFQR